VVLDDDTVLERERGAARAALPVVEGANVHRRLPRPCRVVFAGRVYTRAVRAEARRAAF
jgi:hypothetical protein